MKEKLHFISTGLLFFLSTFLGVAYAQTTFNYTGAMETWVVPGGVTSIQIECYGAEGGSSVVGFGNGGLGGYVTGDFTVTPGETLYIFVGGQGAQSVTGGFNGGGNGVSSPGGGGASDVRQGGSALTDRIIVAGGGGGGAYETAWSSGWGYLNGTADGGDGGDLIGQDGLSWQQACQGGTGGTQSAGGIGGGALGVGGNGAASPGDTGGGGGGYYGGGGGGDCSGYNGAGGGGSSYTAPGALSVSHTQGSNSGDGMIVITPLCSALTTTVSNDTICQYGDLTLDAISMNGGTITWDLGVSNGATFNPDTTGLITYTAMSSNPADCQASVQVLINESPEFTLSSTDEIAGNDGSTAITLVNGIFPFTYDWDNDGTGDFDDPQNLTGLSSGTYTVVVMQGNGCSATSSVVVNSQVGIEEGNMEIGLFPNPTSDNVTIQYNGEFHYEVLNMVGELIMKGTSTDEAKLQLAHLANGRYLIRIISDEVNNVYPLVKY